MTQFNFGSIVVVETNLIGVVVKCWTGAREPSYDVYVRSLNGITEYAESQIRNFVYDKELSDEDMQYQH